MGANGRGVTDEGRIITAVEIERKILALDDQLAEDTVTTERLAKEKADAEVAWKMARAKCRMVERVRPGSGPGGRTTNDEVDDIAMKKNEALYTAFVLAESAYEAHRDAVFTRRSRLEGLRTLAANVRAVT